MTYTFEDFENDINFFRRNLIKTSMEELILLRKLINRQSVKPLTTRDRIKNRTNSIECRELINKKTIESRARAYK